MKNKYKISVIVPIYNCKNYLEETLKSILSQKEATFEIILINDASTDNSGDICLKFKNKYKNITYIPLKKNKGVSNARNVGIKNASGEYIHFMDSDDILDINMYSMYNQIMKQSNYDVIISGYNVIENNMIINQNVANDLLELDKKSEISNLLKDCTPNDKERILNFVWNKLYSKKIIDDNNIQFDTSLDFGEDFLFNCEYFSFINNLCEINNPLYNYIKRTRGNLSSKFRLDLLERRKKMYNAWIKLFNRYNILTEEKLKEIDNYEGFIMYHSLYTIFLDSCKLSKNKKIEFLNNIINDKHIKYALLYLKNGLEYYLIKRKKAICLYMILTLKHRIKKFLRVEQ